MNVSIYNCALNVVNILAAFSVFQFSRTALKNNNKNQPQNKLNPPNNPLYYKTQTVLLRCRDAVALFGTIHPHVFI